MAFAEDEPKRIRVGLIGCGSVSGQYLPQLKKCRYVEVVSLCDRKYERAQRRGKEFNVENTYPSIDAMLAGVPFDFLVDTTDMQEHEGINRRALSWQAGDHADRGHAKKGGGINHFPGDVLDFPSLPGGRGIHVVGQAADLKSSFGQLLVSPTANNLSYRVVGGLVAHQRNR